MTADADKPKLSRRSLFWAAVGIPILLASAHPAAAGEIPKIPKKNVGYRDSPKGSAQCANCKLFIAPSGCTFVKGSVSPNGWCGMWVKA